MGTLLEVVAGCSVVVLACVVAVSDDEPPNAPVAAAIPAPAPASRSSTPRTSSGVRDDRCGCGCGCGGGATGGGAYASGWVGPVTARATVGCGAAAAPTATVRSGSA